MIIPENLRGIAGLLLHELLRIENPTREQVRFAGSLRSAIGIGKRLPDQLAHIAAELAKGQTPEEVKAYQETAR